MTCCASPTDEEVKAMQEASPWAVLKTLLGVRSAPRDPDMPKYWTRSGSKDSALSEETEENFKRVPQEDRALLEALMNRTSKDPEMEFHVVRATRVENPDLWQRYHDCAARIKGRRGRCQFAGRGPPLSHGELEGVELSDGFPSDLDEGICEAYLWHATRPSVAAKILREGFRVSSRSSFGKRFGEGAYFSEDAAKADAYASAGEGLYKDCFAMLLCRVVLGKQYVTNSFRRETAAKEAAAWHDSILAEPRGASYREFVALDDAQVYPEFALMYERTPLSSGSSSRPVLQRCSSHNVPMYWSAACGEGAFFHAVVPDHEVETCVQSLMDLTWIHAFTWERRDSHNKMLFQDDPHHDMPEGMTALKVLRLEDSELWAAYREARHALRLERCGQVQSAAQLGLRTHRPDLPLWARAGLDASSGEAYLWHGCSPKEAMNILQHGFPEEPGCGGTGRCAGMFGRGYYFVESAAKADEHSEDDKEGFYSGSYAMLLCRVLLGRVDALTAPDLKAHERTGRGRPFDSAAGFQEASGGAFREFVVPSRLQVYPEYAIVYERMYDTPRIR